MTYRTLMTHLAHDTLDSGFINKCVDLARDWSAHLDVMCHGVDRLTAGFHYGGVDPVMLQNSFSEAMKDAEDLSCQARAALDKTDVRWAVEQSVSAIGTLGRSVAQRTRFADLVVLQQPYEAQGSETAEIILEGALFEGQSAVLIVPEAVPVRSQPETVVIAWNESREALNAVRAALPLLKKAARVRVTVIDPPRHSSERSDPGGPLSVYLARHGVKAEIDVLGKSMPRVSDVIMRHAADQAADLVVMGAYGHSRFREAILGGATRDMLEQSKAAVMMSH